MSKRVAVEINEKGGILACQVDGQSPTTSFLTQPNRSAWAEYFPADELLLVGDPFWDDWIPEEAGEQAKMMDTAIAIAAYGGDSHTLKLVIWRGNGFLIQATVLVAAPSLPELLRLGRQQLRFREDIEHVIVDDANLIEELKQVVPETAVFHTPDPETASVLGALRWQEVDGVDPLTVRANKARLQAKNKDVDRFKRGLQAPMPTARAITAHLLHNLAWEDAQPLYEQALQDEDARVREAVVSSLTQHRDPQAVTLLPTAVTDELTQYALVEAVLENWLTVDVGELLKPALRSPNLGLQYATAVAFVHQKGIEGVPPILDYVRQTHHKAPLLTGLFHATNQTFLSLADDETVRQDLITTLSDPIVEPAARLIAVRLLAWMQHDAVNMLLEKLYQAEEDQEVKEEMHRFICAVHPVFDFCHKK